MDKEYLKKVNSLTSKELKQIGKKFFDFKFYTKEELDDIEDYEGQFKFFKSVLTGKIPFQDFCNEQYQEDIDDHPTLLDYVNAYNYILNC